MKTLKKMLFIATAGIFMACNQTDDNLAYMEQYHNTTSVHRVYELDDETTGNSGSITLKTDKTFYLTMNTLQADNSYEYLTASGTYNDINSKVVLYITSLYKNQVPQTNTPLTVYAPYYEHTLNLNFPYDQENGAKTLTRSH